MKYQVDNSTCNSLESNKNSNLILHLKDLQNNLNTHNRLKDINPIFALFKIKP